MSELTTSDIKFGYQSPISQIYKDIEYKFKEDMENKTMEAIHHFGISVDKEELIKALQYDRNQYEKGYSDGRASMIEEFESLKAEINEQIDFNESCCERTDLYEAIGIINRRIAELKGE